jgi:S-phase kinase-associated protein 1
MIKLLSEDKKIVELDLELASKSVLLKNMIDDLSDSIDTEIPINNISYDILIKVVEFLKDENNGDFFKMDQDTLMQVILAANFLDINDLLEKSCKEMSDRIQGKSVEEIREIFDIPAPEEPDM